MEAQVWMTGRVGGEVEVRDATSPWSTFRLGCTPRMVRAGEWGDEQTTWVTVSCAHRLAEHVRLSLRKGDPVIVIGKLRTRRWVDTNGVEHEQLQIRASSVGHDLSVGTSSFYRPRREQPAEASASPGGDGLGEDGFGPQGFDDIEPEEGGGAGGSEAFPAGVEPGTPFGLSAETSGPPAAGAEGSVADGGEVEPVVAAHRVVGSAVSDVADSAVSDAGEPVAVPGVEADPEPMAAGRRRRRVA